MGDSSSEPHNEIGFQQRGRGTEEPKEEDREEAVHRSENPSSVLGGSELPELDLFQALANALWRERGTPDLLPAQEALTTEVASQIESQTAHVAALASDPSQDAARQCYELGLRRFRFLLASYHRARIAKIDKYSAAVLDSDELQRRCSAAELRYCLGQFVCRGRCLKDVVLQRLPQEFQTLVQQSQLAPGRDTVPQPPQDGHVFIKLLADAGNVPVEDSGSNRFLPMEAGDIYVIKYCYVRHLVHNGTAVLL